MIISDLGPELKSQMFEELLQLVGMRHVFSIADKHVNGAERLIKEAQRHLRAMVYDTRISNVFSDPTIIPTVQYLINSKHSSQTDNNAYELTFGSQHAIYTRLLKKFPADPSHILLQRLNNNLKILRDASNKYQAELVAERAIANKSAHNSYQPGDYVTFYRGTPHPKMAAKYKGPYCVVSQYKNDVQCRNLITDALLKFSTDDLEPFFCSSNQEAFEAALRDQEQFKVRAILSYTGDSHDIQNAIRRW